MLHPVDYTLDQQIMYYWKDGQMHEFMYRLYSGVVIPDEVCNCYTLDMGQAIDTMRYGIYILQGPWKHVPFEDFPADFKMALLLLGIE